MATNQPLIIVTDTSVLINFLNIDRLDLIGRCSRRFLVTEHVRDEITLNYSEQVQRYEQALTGGIIDEVIVNSIAELTLFSQLMKERRLGQGECSTIAVAIHHGYALAIDDRKAIKEAASLAPSLSVLKTQDILVMMIRESLLTVVEADAILADWAANHRFRLKIKSFVELI